MDIFGSKSASNLESFVVSSLHPSLDERSVQVAGGGQGVLGGGVLPVL